ncbi:glycosyltransferase family 2 protein [Pseudidiomarina terrestris]|uniref:Glycosyltransferase n=1 Tax=Pseudidiomarina terrestris TaxID=2820060 RepID=A0AAW7R108_9GAMM|nr:MULTISPECIES: glycosyltransferase family 2 protein [unclassified Pseudidiomarina]MDN7124486.1 glycosyltransferase [Pseudidiomarina sp. 1APP75-32.1]MDN7129223.1 glycosyltransferase [Pseudidiomarina sp. 1APR75-15]MDN7134511.1 glycosyltransferase [Pseudidiomarina sp. 1ASP75-5]
MNKDIFASFIVPIFNDVEKLAVTLDSIGAVVTERPIEIIIVDDDGPATNEADVYKLLENKGIQTQYLKKQNEGPYYARKYGFSKASGDYIIFVDCGDAVIPENCSQVVTELLSENTIDILVSDILSVENSVRSRKNILPKKHKAPLNSMPASDFFSQCNKNLLGTPGKIYSRATLSSAFASIDLPPGVCNAEDLLLFTTSLGYVKQVHYMNGYFYLYEVHEKSLSHDQRPGALQRRFYDKVCVADSVLSVISNNKDRGWTSLDGKLHRFFRKYRSSVLLHWIFKFPSDFTVAEKLKVIAYYVTTGVLFSSMWWKLSKKQFNYD